MKHKSTVVLKNLLRYKLLFIIVVTVSVVALLDSTNAPSKTDEIVTEVVTFSTETPDEEKPTENFAWKGNDSDPKKIIIPKISVDAFVQNVGVDQKKAIAVPNNIHIAGWFVESARLGETGLSIIDGHVDGRRGAGVFEKLSTLASGDTFTIELGDGSQLTYKVSSVITIPENEAASILFSQDPRITSQLNLITCGGTFDSAKGVYPDRTIVQSVLL